MLQKKKKKKKKKIWYRSEKFSHLACLIFCLLALPMPSGMDHKPNRFCTTVILQGKSIQKPVNEVAVICAFQRTFTASLYLSCRSYCTTSMPLRAQVFISTLFTLLFFLLLLFLFLLFHLSLSAFLLVFHF